MAGSPTTSARPRSVGWRCSRTAAGEVLACGPTRRRRRPKRRRSEPPSQRQPVGPRRSASSRSPSGDRSARRWPRPWSGSRDLRPRGTLHEADQRSSLIVVLALAWSGRLAALVGSRLPRTCARGVPTAHVPGSRRGGLGGDYHHRRVPLVAQRREEDRTAAGPRRPAGVDRRRRLGPDDAGGRTDGTAAAAGGCGLPIRTCRSAAPGPTRSRRRSAPVPS